MTDIEPGAMHEPFIVRRYGNRVDVFHNDPRTHQLIKAVGPFNDALREMVRNAAPEGFSAWTLDLAVMSKFDLFGNLNLTDVTVPEDAQEICEALL
jgi:hypothetical protein